MNVEDAAWKSYKVAMKTPHEILSHGHTPLLLMIIRDRVLGEMYHPQEGERVLEIGGGTCYTSYMVKSIGQDDKFVIGTDISFQALMGAQSLAHIFPKRLDGLTCCDSTSLPFKSGLFDTILGVAVLHHLEHPEAGCREISRVLRPGGRYLGIEGSVPRSFRRFVETMTAAHYRVHEEGVREDMFDSDSWRRMFGAAGLQAQVTPLRAPEAYKRLINTRPQPESYRPRYKLRYPYERILALFPARTANLLVSRILPATVWLQAIKR